jgi:uncharacterized repeat protein (TIGR03803 family)
MFSFLCRPAPCSSPKPRAKRLVALAWGNSIVDRNVDGRTGCGASQRPRRSFSSSLVVGWIFFLVVWTFSATVAHAQAATRTTLAIPTDFALNMIQGSDGSLYSTSGPLDEGCQDNVNNQCSFIYKIAPDGTLSTFHAFQEVSATYIPPANSVTNADGLQPSAFFEGADGNFYGACEAGGPGGLGTIFKIAPDGTFSLVYSFPTTPLYGGLAPLNGGAPNSLIQGADGNLYGTTLNGTQAAVGTGGLLFEVTPGGTFNALIYFQYVQDPVSGSAIYPKGAGPTSIVQGDNGDFFLSMNTGPGLQTSPRPNLGAIDEVTPGGVATVLFTFPVDGSDGVPSAAPLVEGSDGSFYGTTAVTLNNTQKYPTLAYKVSPSGGFSQLYQFTPGGPDGNSVGSNGGLILGSDLNFYGVTNFGGNITGNYCMASNGPLGCGTFFRLQPSGVLTTLYTFAGGVSTSPTTGLGTADGAHPLMPITQGPGGVFYGITTGGGTTAATVSYPTVYSLALTNPLPSPVQLSFTVNGNPVNSVKTKTPVTLTWSVLNAFSQTAQQCHASILGSPLGAGNWGGPQIGSVKQNIYTGTATITPNLGGQYTYVLNCGGVEIGMAKLTVSGITITTIALPDGVVSVPYLAPVQSLGGVSPDTWGTVDALPDGLHLLATPVDSTVNVAGTPMQFGKYTATLVVQDSSNPTQIAASDFTFTIASGLLLTGTLNNGIVGVAYNKTATAMGGLPPYKWLLASGTLPPGLTLNTGNGAVTGMPTIAGTYPFTITVMDAEGTPATVTKSYSISTIDPPLNILHGMFPDCTVNVFCEGQYEATGGTPPYTWSVQAGTVLPAGITLASNGIFSGIPTQSSCIDSSNVYGRRSYLAVQVADSSTPALTNTDGSYLCILSTLKVVSVPLPVATVGISYQAPPPVATGGTPPYTWKIVPADLIVIDEYGSSPAKGALYSITVPMTTGSFPLTYTVSDSEGDPAEDIMVATLTVNPLTIASVTVLSSSNSASGVGMPVTLTARVTATGSMPGGIVTFYNGSALLGTATLDATGTGTLTTSFAATGVYSLTATYAGFGPILGSVSTALSETVVTVGVTGSISPASITIPSGSSGTLTITVIPMGGYTGTVNFSCGTLPTNVSCTFVPPSLTLTAGGGPVSDTLTIHTMAAQTTMLSSPSDGTGILYSGLFLWLPVSLTGLGVLFRRKQKSSSARNLFLLAILCLGLAAVGTFTGCGAGPSRDAKAGTYTIPVTLTLAGGATQTVNATVIVQ